MEGHCNNLGSWIPYLKPWPSLSCSLYKCANMFCLLLSHNNHKFLINDLLLNYDVANNV
jgi:hypothetical protein